MGETLRLDFPPEIVREREEVYGAIRRLLALQTPEAAQSALNMHLQWVERYPDDFIALDAGEVLIMTAEAYSQIHSSLEATQVGTEQAKSAA